MRARLRRQVHDSQHALKRAVGRRLREAIEDVVQAIGAKPAIHVGRWRGIRRRWGSELDVTESRVGIHIKGLQKEVPVSQMDIRYCAIGSTVTRDVSIVKVGWKAKVSNLFLVVAAPHPSGGHIWIGDSFRQFVGNKIRHAVGSAIAVRADLLRVADVWTAVGIAYKRILDVQVVHGHMVVESAEILAEIFCTDAEHAAPVHINIWTGEYKVDPIQIGKEWASR